MTAEQTQRQAQRSYDDAAKGALGDAASKESGAKGARDKAVSDKAATDATAKGAKDALAKARSTEAAAEVDVTKKEATAPGCQERARRRPEGL